MPVWSMGVHGCEATHSLPHPEQENSSSPSSRPPVADHPHRERQEAITSGWVTGPRYLPVTGIDRVPVAWEP